MSQPSLRSQTLIALAALGFTLSACTPQPGEDKSVSDTGDAATSSDDGGGDDGGGDDGGGDDGGGDDGGGDDGGGDDGGGDDGGGDDGGGDDDGGDDDGGDDGEPAPVELPVEGGWTLVAQSLTDDPCGVANYQDPSGFVASSYEVNHIDAETFSLSAAGEDPGDCDVAGGASFSCAPAQLRQDLSGYGFAAEMVVDTEFNGSLDSDFLTMTGVTDVTVTCDGDCWLFELALDFPCPMSIDMTLEAD